MIIGLFLHLLLFSGFLQQSSVVSVQAQSLSEQDDGSVVAGQQITFPNALPLADDRYAGPQRKDGATSLGLNITADYAIVADARSGKVLFEKNSSSSVPIASITKIMTALVFLDTKPQWDRLIVMQQSDERVGAQFHLYRGEKLFTSDVFRVALIASDNNAIIALARSTGLSPEDFVAKMNEKAQTLGMLHSSFVEPSGLDAANVSSAFDLALLFHEASTHQLLQEVTTTQKYTFTVQNTRKRRSVTNTNLLLGGYLDTDGYEISVAKTGYITESGYNLASYIKDTKGDGSLVVVVLSSADHYSRFSEVKNLSLWAFDNFSW